MSWFENLTENFELNWRKQEFVTCALFASICLWILLKISRTIHRLKLLPDGPWGLPFIGYLPFIKPKNYLQFLELSKKYGPVFSVKLGQHDVVVLNNWPSIKEAFGKEELLARPKTSFFAEITPDKSFGEMTGLEWRQHRRVAMQVLKDVGLGKSTMEEMVKDEVLQLMEEIEKHADGRTCCDLEKLLSPSVANNVAVLVFGHKFAYDDPEKISFDRNFDKLAKNFRFAGISTFLPLLAKILIKIGLVSYKDLMKAFHENMAFQGREIKLHQDNLTNGNEPAIDYIDGYLKEKRTRETEDSKISNDEAKFDLITLNRNISFILGAGFETLRSTLEWAMLILVKYPEYQARIREEIYSVFGTDVTPSYGERSRLPYTMSFINETHRYGSVIASNLLRRASEDVRIGSVNIPKDSIVIFNFYAVHYDPTLWNNPEIFDPERFLTKDGSKVTKPAYLIPFSGGKRICPGEGLANVELFLYLTILVQKFRIKALHNAELSMESEFGLSRRPKDLPSFIFEKISH